MFYPALTTTARRNAAQALRLAQNWLSGGQIKKAQKEPAPGAHPLLEAEESAWLKKKTAADKKPIPAARLPVTPARWKERDYAETTRWEWEQRQRAQEAYEHYRRGKREYLQPTTQPQKPWWQWAGEWVADRIDDVTNAIQSGWDALRVRHLKFTKLEDGHISVRAETPPGTRIEYRQTVAEVMESNFSGMRYNPKTVAAKTSGGLLRSAVSIRIAGVGWGYFFGKQPVDIWHESSRREDVLGSDDEEPRVLGFDGDGFCRLGGGGRRGRGSGSGFNRSFSASSYSRFTCCHRCDCSSRYWNRDWR